MVVQKSVVKKVRLTPAEAKELARIARRRKSTESDVLREGLTRMARAELRGKAVDQLIQWATEEKEDYNKPEIDVKW